MKHIFLCVLSATLILAGSSVWPAADMLDARLSPPGRVGCFDPQSPGVRLESNGHSQAGGTGRRLLVAEPGSSHVPSLEQTLGSTLQQTWNVDLVGQIGGDSYAVAISGTLAYLGVGPRLVILDIADLTHPSVIGKTSVLPGMVMAVSVVGSYAYVANDVGGLRIINVANPAAPSEVGFYDTPSYASDVAVAGTYAYVADTYDGLRIVDIANPVAPTEVAQYDTNCYAVGVAVAGKYAYVADSEGGLLILSVAIPSMPGAVGFYYTARAAEDVAVAGSYAYVATGYGGLRIINVANPYALSEAGFDASFATSVAVAGSYAYVAAGGDGLRVINVANPAAPAESSVYNTPGFAVDVAVRGDVALVADRWSGMRAISIADPATPAESGSYETVGTLYGVAVGGGYAYVAADASLRVIDVANPAEPVVVGSCALPGSARAVALADEYAYVADWNGGLRVINVANPTAPTEVGFSATPGTAKDVAVAGQYAYVADWNGGLRVINVANPTAPAEVGFNTTPDSAGDVAVAGGYAYVANWASALHIISVANPAAPLQVGFYDTIGTTEDVAVAGQYAYVADALNGLLVLNVANPAAPMRVGLFDTPGEGLGVAVAGWYAYVADGSRGLRIGNVADATAPIEAGFYDTAGYARGVAVSEGYAYVADDVGGLLILRLTDVRRVNAGGPTYTDLAGLVWNADQALTPGGWGYDPPSAGILSTTIPIDQTADDPLYQDARAFSAADLPQGYHFTVPKAVYSITLKFAEVDASVLAGDRGFTIIVEGVTKTVAFDIYTMAEPNGVLRALDWTTTVPVADGQLGILFAPAGALNAIVNAVAVEIKGRGYTFDDVPPSHPDWLYIEKLSAAGITAGTSTNPPLYSPDLFLSRAQIATFIDRALGWPAASPVQGLFVDMPLDFWGSPWTETLYQHGVTTGCTADPLAYCPSDLLTKAQIATMIVRANGWAVNAPTQIFSDIAGTPAAWAEGSIEAFYAHSPGTQCGTNPLRFCPSTFVSRAYMAELLVKGFGL